MMLLYSKLVVLCSSCQRRPHLSTCMSLLESQLSPELVCRLLAGRRYAIQDERSLQDGLEQVLRASAVPYVREFVLDASSRPDFMLGNLAIEVKTKGSVAQFLRQAYRYLEHDQVHALIAIGTPHWLGALPPELAGKPLYGVRLLNSLL